MTDSDRNLRVRVRTKKFTSSSQFRAPFVEGRREDSWVVIYDPQTRHRCERHVLDAERGCVTVGRSSQCDIVLDGASASRQHARILHEGSDWVVVDLGSLNGVWVNDRREVRHVLVHGDRIQIGDTIFKHLAADHADAAYLEAVRVALLVDGLTQASTERAFREALDAATRRGHEERSAVSLILADIDHFKRINDAHGHPAGDRVLREFAAVVRESLMAGAELGRVGGEEFGVLVTGVGLEHAVALAEGLRAAVAAHRFDALEGQAQVTASWGVAALGAPGDTAVGIFQRADLALYRAKHAGRNRVMA